MINFEERLKQLENGGLLRHLKQVQSQSATKIFVEDKECINFSSNDYLGLARDMRLVKRAEEGLRLFGVGAKASRLVSGSLRAHFVLERALSEFKQREAALVFPAGYMTNIGLLNSIAGQGDAVIIDRLNHASIIDAARLSGARIFVYRHKDMNSLEKALKRSRSYQKKIIATDSVFSMDGDMAPLDEIVRLSKTYDAYIMLDEAHATGIFGRNGRGIAEFTGLEENVDFSMGTLSKALGCQGGFVAGRKELIDFLVNRARSFIYTTGLAPSLCWAACEAIEIVNKEPERRKKLLESAGYLRKELNKAGFNTLESCSQIIPVLTGNIYDTIAISGKLLEKGIFAPPMRPPTVPEEMCRLRISLVSEHSVEEINYLIDCLKGV